MGNEAFPSTMPQAVSGLQKVDSGTDASFQQAAGAPLRLAFNGEACSPGPMARQELMPACRPQPDEQPIREHKWRRCSDAVLEIHRCATEFDAIDILGVAVNDVVSARQCVISLRPGDLAAERSFVFRKRTNTASNSLSGVVSYVRRRIRQTRKPLRLTRQELQARRNGHVYAGIELDIVQVNGLLAVPVPGRDGTIDGLVQASDRTTGDFSDLDEMLLVRLVQNFAVAIAKLRLCEQLHDRDRRKDEFLTTLAHELRNPLAPIRSGLQLLQRTRDEALKTSTRQGMERQLEHLTLLVEDLLDVSSINLGKLKLRRSHFDFRNVLHTAVESVRPLLAARQHKLQIDLPQAGLPLDADEARLCQVLINLLNNAAKYTPPHGRITLTVTTKEGRLMLKIQDNGVGISPAMLPKLFDLFLQVDSSAKYAQGGLGVGLPLVRRLIELHGGTIAASSEGLDKGSVFSLTLPLAGPGGSGAVAGPDHAQSPAPGHLDILVVDDNVDAAQSLAALLRVGGHEVTTAYDAQTAIEIALRLRPQVIVLDIELHGPSGYEIARTLRREDTFHPMLIAMTGRSSEHDRQLAFDAGFDAHLVKPVDIHRLNELLQLYDRANAQASLASMMPTGEWS